MKKSLSALALIMSVMTAPAVFATERTVTFAIDNDGMLNVSARDSSTGQVQQTRLGHAMLHVALPGL